MERRPETEWQRQMGGRKINLSGDLMDTAGVFWAVRAAVVEVGGEKGENKQNKSRRESTFIRGCT